MATQRKLVAILSPPQLLERSHEQEVSTRDRPAEAGTDARIEESAARGKVRLAPRPYGRTQKPTNRAARSFGPQWAPGCRLAAGP